MIVHLLKISLKYIYITLIFIVQSNLLSMEKQKIILIHGFMGWGESEMGNYHYWGGHIDIESYLRSEGFEVHAISVGPISSNWDRAVEAYFKIKGGQVDYGATHSSKYNLIQKPEGVLIIQFILLHIVREVKQLGCLNIYYLMNLNQKKAICLQIVIGAG